jgi:hypothetical protein
MTPKHITLATVATALTIVGSIFGGLAKINKYADDRQTQALRQILEHERHDEEIDQRLGRLELAVRASVMNDSQRQRDLVEQVLSMRSQLQQVSQTQDSYVIPKVQRLENAQYPADAPAVTRPQ